MDVFYENKKVEALCTDERRALKELGKNGFRKLRARLADLDAAHSVGQLQAGRPHVLHGDRAGQLALDLDKGRRLVLEPADEPPPLDENGKLMWAQVQSVRIVFIGDYHD